MKSEFLTAFNQICADRNLPREVVLEAIKTALVSAYRRNTVAPAGQNVTVEIDPETGEAIIYAEREVVEKVVDAQMEVALDKARKMDPKAEIGDVLMVESTPRNFGRIAAQTARQVILQRIREAERDAQFAHYVEQEGELVYGTVQSINPQFVTLHLGRTEAVMPRKEQVPGERYTLHSRIRAYVLEVRRTTRGPHIIVSRAHKKMLRRMLELEVPEISNGTVEIKSISREAGSRSKVAVVARQAGVDPVGACVGMRGMRIQSIVRELGGEKVDIIEWSTDPVTFIAKSLSPARVLSVQLDEDPIEGKTASVVVPDDQLSLAIGRAGQNARLAAKLTSWRIDIQGATEAIEWALKKVNDNPDILPELGAVAEKLPVIAAALRRFKDNNLPYNAEELMMMRDFIEGVRAYFISLRNAERARLVRQEAARKAALAEAREARKAVIDEARALIPKAAYDVSISEIGLSPRVLAHLERSGLETVGQLREQLAEGNEGLLKFDGIGPKSLSEIHDALDQLSFPEEAVEPVAEAVAEVVEIEAEEDFVEEPPAEVEEAVVALEAAEEVLEALPEEAPEALLPEALLPEEALAVDELEGAALEPEPAAVELEPGAEAAEGTGLPLEWEDVEVDLEEEEDSLFKDKSKGQRTKKRRLVYDEDLGETIAVRRHWRDMEEEDDWKEYV
ncbi:MAG: transcription termination/antitermination protein NusA [Anaerolineae bacterium]|nr:transcription termination/antitermination protein NusA [Anaerolineae bacterium]